MFTVKLKKKNDGKIIAIPTTDAYNKSDYKWDPQLKKTVYIGKNSQKGNSNAIYPDKKETKNKIKNEVKKFSLKEIAFAGDKYFHLPEEEKWENTKVGYDDIMDHTKQVLAEGNTENRENLISGVTYSMLSNDNPQERKEILEMTKQVVQDPNSKLVKWAERVYNNYVAIKLDSLGERQGEAIYNSLIDDMREGFIKTPQELEKAKEDTAYYQIDKYKLALEDLLKMEDTKQNREIYNKQIAGLTEWENQIKNLKFKKY